MLTRQLSSDRVTTAISADFCSQNGRIQELNPETELRFQTIRTLSSSVHQRKIIKSLLIRFFFHMKNDYKAG